VTGVLLVNKTIGLIGYRNHASRIRTILETEFKDVKIKKIFHPTKKFSDGINTNNFEELYDCDCIFILSPNETHFEYIMKLIENYEGYIFCEKPVVTESSEFNIINKLDKKTKQRIFFNFNLRYGKMNDILKKEVSKMGDISYVNIISSHGLAFKEEYINSWRADGSKNRNNILDTLAIHYLDLILFHIPDIRVSNYLPYLISKNGTSFDTCLLVLSTEKLSFSIYCSYANPMINEVMVIGTKGYLTIRDEKQEIFSPRDTFDENGFFKKPPMSNNKKFNFEEEYKESLKNSVKFFMNHMIENTPIDENIFEKSMQTTRFLIDLKS